MRRLLVASLAFAFACKGNDSTGTDPNAPTRGYRMGFSALPPRLDQASVQPVINHWSTRADAAIIHVRPTWPALLAGFTADTIVRTLVLPLAQIYRSRNLQLFVTIDVTSGLNRTAEAPELLAARRSITEPAVQMLYHRSRPECISTAAAWFEPGAVHAARFRRYTAQGQARFGDLGFALCAATPLGAQQARLHPRRFANKKRARTTSSVHCETALMSSVVGERGACASVSSLRNIPRTSAAKNTIQRRSALRFT